MIKVNLMEMCDNCPLFDVTVTSHEYDFNGERVYDRTITCNNICMCEMHLEYLRKEVKKNGNEKE